MDENGHDLRVILHSEDDLAFEEDILRNAYSVKHWLRYVDHKKSSESASPQVVNMIYERGLKELPGSYKLWHSYLQWRVENCSNRPIIDNEYKQVNNCFERALVFMHKMPRIWLDYCGFLFEQNLITKTRRTFNRCLQSLPVTQHMRIWPLYLKFIKSHDIPETALRVYKRYLKLQPEDAEDYIDYLRSAGKLNEAAVQLAKIVNRDNFISKEGKSKHQLWSELCELISKNPEKIHSLKVDAIIREGIKRYTDQQGKLWNSLAEYYIRCGLFEKARDIYEEAISSVMTIRDFSQVFDAYAQSEEKLINAKLEAGSLTEDEDAELELRLARYEDLIERRPLLLNSIALRQNPHNVEEWHKRVDLLKDKPVEVINTYTNAVQIVDPKQAIGKVYTLWVNFAKFYEENDQIDDARLIFEKAVQADFHKVDDLASVWCEWAELELRNGNFAEALRIMQKATASPPKKAGYFDQNEPVQYRVYRSLKLWSMYADLEESFGTFKTTKAVYDRIIDLRIATPQIIINYGMFLEEHNYFEEAFKAYEKGVSLFKWPNVYDIWNIYLTKFLKRYGGNKLERARDLFEQCLDECPGKYAKAIYLLYAKLEEDHGLAKHVVAIYDRATKAILVEDQFDMFNIYIKRAAEMFGITYTRHIYEKAIEVLPDDQAREMCLRFADLERKLGEIDRARAVYSHCSQLCDPRTQLIFWQIWKEFEIKHGNEDTIREMLRIKRSIQATFNTQVNFMTAQMLVAAGIDENKEPSSMQILEETRVGESNQIAKQPEAKKKGIMFVTEAEKQKEVNPDTMKTLNPDEIDIDEDEETGNDDDDDDDDGVGDDEEDESTNEEIEQAATKRARDMKLLQKMVPKGVFGSLKPRVMDET